MLALTRCLHSVQPGPSAQGTVTPTFRAGFPHLNELTGTLRILSWVVLDHVTRGFFSSHFDHTRAWKPPEFIHLGILPRFYIFSKEDVRAQHLPSIPGHSIGHPSSRNTNWVSRKSLSKNQTFILGSSYPT